jgi:hypothetical protein
VLQLVETQARADEANRQGGLRLEQRCCSGPRVISGGGTLCSDTVADDLATPTRSA